MRLGDGRQLRLPGIRPGNDREKIVHSQIVYRGLHRYFHSDIAAEAFESDVEALGGIGIQRKNLTGRCQRWGKRHLKARVVEKLRTPAIGNGRSGSAAQEGGVVIQRRPHKPRIQIMKRRTENLAKALVQPAKLRQAGITGLIAIALRGWQPEQGIQITIVKWRCGFDARIRQAITACVVELGQISPEGRGFIGVRRH